MRNFLVGIVACIVLGVVGAVVYSFSGRQNIAASEPDNFAVAWFLHNTYEHSLDAAADTIAVPPGLETPAAVRAGAKIYGDECVYCHGAPGEDATGLAKGLNPQPPVLLASDRDNLPNETFWVVKNGVRMSGMPAWGKSYNDTQIWSVAAFLHSKRGVSPAEYKALVSGEDG